METPNRWKLYEATIRRMVEQSLEHQEEEFARAHEDDTDMQLLAYLRESAWKLQHSPGENEIVGWQLIRTRFGSWESALRKAGLPEPQMQDEFTGYARVQEEIERQKVLYREKKAAKKLRHQQRIQAQQEKRKRNT